MCVLPYDDHSLLLFGGQSYGRRVEESTSIRILDTQTMTVETVGKMQRADYFYFNQGAVEEATGKIWVMGNKHMHIVDKSRIEVIESIENEGD